MNSGTVRIKHVRFRETGFRGISFIAIGTQSHEKSKPKVVEVDLLEAKTRVNMPKNCPRYTEFERSEQLLELDQDVLTFTQTVSSKVRKTPPGSGAVQTDDDGIDKYKPF